MVVLNEYVCSPIAAATKGAIASTRTNETLISDCTKANVRPRTSSSTSKPSIVKPVTQEIPANKPSRMVIKIANTRFSTSDNVTSINPEIVSDTPNNLRLENWENILGPKEIPSAKPKNTAANKIPYAASPAFKSSTNVLAKPITAPAAKNAPSIPNIKPRIIFESFINAKPSQSDLPIEL